MYQRLMSTVVRRGTTVNDPESPSQNNNNIHIANTDLEIQQQQQQEQQQQTDQLNININKSTTSSSLDKESNDDGDNVIHISSTTKNDNSISQTGLGVLALLAFQNCFKNLLMRFVMKDNPKFLFSTAVITVELLKLFFSASYIVGYQKQSLASIYRFIFVDDKRNSFLLSVPASCYIIQMTLEYVAFANIDAASFSVLVQLKVLSTALFFKLVLGKRMMMKQVLSLVILTVGVMLCNMSNSTNGNSGIISGDQLTGILATLGIAVSSGFASVYTEKVIKASHSKIPDKQSEVKKQGGLAYMQCQLAIVSLLILGFYALIKDYNAIINDGFFQNFGAPAFISCLNSAVGGLIVAGVLKYANSVLKGYATAISVVLTGILSSRLFGTNLSLLFVMGIINVVVSVVLYNANGLDEFMC